MKLPFNVLNDDDLENKEKFSRYVTEEGKRKSEFRKKDKRKREWKRLRLVKEQA